MDRGTSINFVNSSIVCTLLKDSGFVVESCTLLKSLLKFANFRYKGDLSPALGTEHSDLVPGTYEGGLKVWECSEDLARFLLIGYKVIAKGR